MNIPLTTQQVENAKQAAIKRIASLNIDKEHTHPSEQIITTIAGNIRKAIEQSAATVDPVAIMDNWLNRVDQFSQRVGKLPAWKEEKQHAEAMLALECLGDALGVKSRVMELIQNRERSKGIPR